MARTTIDGRELRDVLSWLLRRTLVDADIAEAMNVSASTVSRYKDANGDFPGRDDLATLCESFDVLLRPLEVLFGFRQLDELIVFTDAEMRAWIELGGANLCGLSDRCDVDDCPVIEYLRRTHAG